MRKVFAILLSILFVASLVMVASAGNNQVTASELSWLSKAPQESVSNYLVKKTDSEYLNQK